jgi:hypothetical protein
MRLKVRKVQREEKKKEKTCFVSWKVFLSFCYFFISPFLLHLKDDSRA